MTCIIGLAVDGKVYMGSDSMASSGSDRHVTALRKVFRVGEFLIGYTDSFRMGQILQYHLEVRQQQDGETEERFMVVGFVEAVRECLKDKGFASINDNVEKGGTFLVGYRGKVYEMNSDFQVNHWTSGIAVCGAGEQYALAALVALHNWLPEDRVRRALEISAQLSVYVQPPFLIEIL